MNPLRDVSMQGKTYRNENLQRHKNAAKWRINRLPHLKPILYLYRSPKLLKVKPIRYLGHLQ
jgi:hypothetical protein